MNKFILYTFCISITLNSYKTFAQADTSRNSFTLDDCLAYALENKPSVRQSLIDEEIGEREIRAALSAWLPQVISEFGYTNNIKLPTNIIDNNGQVQQVTFGVRNNSNLLLQADQVLYNNDVLFAAKSARLYRQQNKQNVIDNKINTVVTVSKVFYDVLLTNDQLSVLDNVIKRQQKQYKDAYSQYEVGIVDKTDYKRATISLNNAKSERKKVLESIKYKTAYLKELIGYPLTKPITFVEDRARLEQNLLTDTTQIISFDKRIEYRQLMIQKQLQVLNVNYYKWNFLPTVSAFINYNFIYQNKEFSQLYDRSFPASQTGLRLSVPIFTGTRRIQNLRKAQLQNEKIDIDITNTQSVINTEYETALANYKSNLTDYKNLKENVEVATDVYEVIKLQYDEGIKTYLEVITAESDLRTAQLAYINSTFNVLSSKLDMQKALGNIEVN